MLVLHKQGLHCPALLSFCPEDSGHITNNVWDDVDDMAWWWSKDKMWYGRSSSLCVRQRWKWRVTEVASLLNKLCLGCAGGSRVTWCVISRVLDHMGKNVPQCALTGTALGTALHAYWILVAAACAGYQVFSHFVDEKTKHIEIKWLAQGDEYRMKPEINP